MSLVTTNREFRTSWWAIDLAPNWFAEQEDYCTSVTKQDGVGALQISAYKHDSGIVPEDDFRDFLAGEFPEHLTPQPVTCGAFSGVGVDYVANGKFWLKRWVHERGLLLYITYNCAAAERALESAETAQMLSSLQPSDAT